MVDLGTENITAIHGLGFKNWGNSKLDASDKDGGNEFGSFFFLNPVSNLIIKL